MLDKLIDLIIQIWDVLFPIVKIYDYEQAVVMRNGKFLKIWTAGRHYKIPYFDDVLNHHVSTTTIALSPQSLTTKDGQSIVVKGMIKYKVTDIHAFLILVNDAKDAMVDSTMGIIRETVNERDWVEVQTGKIDGLISSRVTKAMKEYGIAVEKVTLTDMAIMKSFRLFLGEHTIV